MAQMTTQRQALCGASLTRSAARVPRPFVAARSRMVVAAAQQGPSDAFMKTVGAIAAAQIALLPFAGVAAAGPLGKQDPVATLQQKARESASTARQVAGKGGVPDPIKVLNRAERAAKSVSANPARDFARKAERSVKKPVAAAKKAAPKASAIKRDVKKIGAKVANPTAEFVKKSKAGLKKGPLATIGFPYGDLQHDVLFGFGEKKAQKKVESAASDVKEGAKAADAKAKDAVPDGFNIFNADSVADVRKELKQNINDAVTKSDQDPAQNVVPEGASNSKPGESQEDNAEKVRREAESGNAGAGSAATDAGDAKNPSQGGGDARAPTSQ